MKISYYKIFCLALALFTFNSFLVPNCMSQWVYMSNGMSSTSVYSLGLEGSYIFSGTESHGVYLSTNNGTFWAQTSLNNRTVLSFEVIGSNIFAGTLTYGVYRSTNNGTTWVQTPLSDRSVNALAYNNTFLLAGTSVGTFEYGVYLSTNYGVGWFPTSLNNRVVYSLAVNGINAYAGTYSFGVYLSTNMGVNWVQTSLNNKVVYCIALEGNNIFAGTNTGLYLSTNNCTSWSQTSLNNLYVYSLTVNGNYIFAGTVYPNTFYMSSDNGVNWTQRNEGFSNNLSVYATCILNNYIFAGTEGSSGNGVYRRPLNELIGVKPISKEIPISFSLSQNYPNPFNPATKIRYQIPQSSYVEISVFDMLGREAAVLVNEKQNPGTYEADFDASLFTSGVYFYRLQAGDYSETKEMILIK